MWRCLNLKENNLPSACQSLKKKFILQSLLNIMCTTPEVRLARLWQALENNRHCLPLKQRVSTAVLCYTTAATGAVTNCSLLKPVFGNLGSKTGPKMLSQRRDCRAHSSSHPRSSCGWGMSALGQQHESCRATRNCLCFLLPFPFLVSPCGEGHGL